MASKSKKTPVKRQAKRAHAKKKSSAIARSADSPPTCRIDWRIMREYASFEEADEADRRESWDKTPAQRMRNLELLRQLHFGYGQGKPYPKFKRTFRIAKLEGR